MTRIAKRRFRVVRETPWGVPLVIEREVDNAIATVVAEEKSKGELSFKRNRVYTLEGLCKLLIMAALQGIGLKHEIALFGNNVEGQAYTKQNLEYRLNTFPLVVLWAIFRYLCNGFQNNLWSRGKHPVVSKRLRKKFTDIVAVDGTTLDQMRRTPKVKKEKDKRMKECNSYKVLSGGHLLVMISLATQMIRNAVYHADAVVNDTNFTKELASWIQRGSLVIMDRGFYSYKLFMKIKEQRADFIIPFRKGTRILNQIPSKTTPRYSESFVDIGIKPNLPFQLRMIEYKDFPKRGNKTGTRVLLVSVLDTKKLTAEEIIRCYDQRWGIEKCFSQLKNPLGLSQLWSSKLEHIEIQVLVTMIAYLLYNRFRITIANELEAPVQDVSLVATKQRLKSLSVKEDPQTITGWLSLFEKVRKLCRSLRVLLVENSKAVRELQKQKEEYFKALSHQQAA